MDAIVCYVCHGTVPTELKNQHHVRPQAAGGGPDDEIPLCSGCHQSLHQVSNMMLNPKRAGKVEDVVNVMFESAPAKRRLLEMARLVAEWMRNRTLDPDAEVDLMITLPVRVKLALQVMASEATVQGRSVGMARYVRNLVCAAVFDRYPELADSLRNRQ